MSGVISHIQKLFKSCQSFFAGLAKLFQYRLISWWCKCEVADFKDINNPSYYAASLLYIRRFEEMRKEKHRIANSFSNSQGKIWELKHDLAISRFKSHIRHRIFLAKSDRNLRVMRHVVIPWILDQHYTHYRPLMSIKVEGSHETQSIHNLARRYLAKTELFWKRANLDLMFCYGFGKTKAVAQGYLIRKQSQRVREESLILNALLVPNLRRLIAKEKFRAMKAEISLAIIPIQSRMRGLIAKKRLLDLRLADREKFRATAFPRLGKELADGCDCWLPDPSTPEKVPKGLIPILFGRDQISPIRLLDGDVWLLKRSHNGTNVVLTKIDTMWFIHTATDCHLQEGVIDRFHGHSFTEKVVIRQTADGFKVVAFRPYEGLTDLSTLVEDQHQAVTRHRSFLPLPVQNLQVAQEGSTVLGGNQASRKMKLMRDVWVTAEEKAALRREKRQRNKDLRKQGIKVERVHVPFWAQGLKTSQEYHEVRERRIEDTREWLRDQGRRALPQAVKEWLTSHQGSDQWQRIHNFAVTRREFALSELDKTNKLLAKLYDFHIGLELNENLVEHYRKEQAKARALRDAQLVAKDARNSNSIAPIRDNKIKESVEAENFSIKNYQSSSGSNWADDEDDDSYFENDLKDY